MLVLYLVKPKKKEKMHNKKDYNKRFSTRYAKGKDGSLVEAKKGMSIDQSYTCAGCGEEVRAYAVNTKIQVAHFRHVEDSQNSGCGDSESYIHWTSKVLFAKVYRNAKSFIFKYKVFNSCKQAKDERCGKEILYPFDLKVLFPYIKVEKRDGSFIPDCMIFNNNGEKVYIEIKYLSAVSQEKIKNGIRIIEIEIKDDSQMLRIISDKSISEECSAIKLYNFDRNRIKSATYDCQGQCINTEYIPRPKSVKRIYDIQKPQKRI